MKAALYIDLDNMLGYCYSLNYAFLPDKLVEYATKEGDDLCIKKSYGDIDAFLRAVTYPISKESVLSRLEKVGIEHTNLGGRKNSADLALAVDLVSNKDEFDKLYLVSSDNDFSYVLDQFPEKDVTRIRMFKTDESITYPEIVGIDTPSGIDMGALIYKNTLEHILKCTLPSFEEVQGVCREAVRNIRAGMTLVELADSISLAKAYKIIMTAYFGRGFLSESGYLLAIRDRGTAEELQSAFYRQCEFLLRRKFLNLEARALNKAFFLKGYRYDLTQRKLVKEEDDEDNEDVPNL